MASFAWISKIVCAKPASCHSHLYVFRFVSKIVCDFSEAFGAIGGGGGQQGSQNLRFLYPALRLPVPGGYSHFGHKSDMVFAL